MSGTARHTKEMIEAAKKKLAASTDPVDKVNYIFQNIHVYILKLGEINMLITWCSWDKVVRQNVQNNGR